MNHLASHLEILLLENDCVVIPGFGGFIAHSVSAVWNKEENLFLPPARIIGFNPQLTMNDGLLIQSYMNTYKIDYKEANKMLELETKDIIDTLNNEGKVELPFIGQITYSANESYQFTPYDEKLNSPVFYGLNSFSIQDVNSLVAHNEPKQIRILKPKKTYTLNPVWRNAAAVAAAIILIFFMSTNSEPIENTYVEKQNYANVFPGELFNKIKNESLITTQVVASNKVQQNKTNQQTAKTQQATPIAAKEVKVPKAEPVASTPQAEKKYYLIISSVASEVDAQRIVENLHAKGFTKAEVVQGDGKIRVSIASYNSKNEASKELTELRKVEAYSDAWILEK